MLSFISFNITAIPFCYYFKVKIHLPLSNLYFSIWLILISAGISCYISEKISKKEFLNLKHNECMNREIRLIFEKLPQGILLKDDKTKKIILANAELKRLINYEENNDKH